MGAVSSLNIDSSSRRETNFVFFFGFTYRNKKPIFGDSSWNACNVNLSSRDINKRRGKKERERKKEDR